MAVSALQFPGAIVKKETTTTKTETTTTKTVVKINMCQVKHKALMSLCGANDVDGQINCTHHLPHSFLPHCMFFRTDMLGACDNWWAQSKKEMPADFVKSIRG